MLDIDEGLRCSCFIIGEGAPLIACADILVEKGFGILGVVSKDDDARLWSDRNRVLFIDSDTDLMSVVQAQPYDILFSINNSIVLGEELCKSPKRYTINYHDAPLPKYAGVHATSWALLNGENSHGVSWHCIEDNVIDGGKILRQSRLAIEPNESVFSLNIKCFESAIEEFRILTDELSVGNEKPLRQDLSKRTYFGRYKRLPDAGLINWDNVERTDAMIRSLQFGRHSNALGTAKIYFKGNFFIAENSKVLKIDRVEPGGMILRVKKKGIIMSCEDGDIEIGDVFTIDGEELSNSDLESLYGVARNERLPNLDPLVKSFIVSFDNECCRYEQYWVNKLEQLEPLIHPYCHFNLVNVESDSQFRKGFGTIILKKQVVTSVGYSTTHVLTNIVSYLARVTDIESFDLGLSCHDLFESESTVVNNFFSDVVPLHIEADLCLSFNEVLSLIEKEWLRTKQSKSFIRDVFHRYPKLNFLKSQKATENLFSIGIALVDDFYEYEADFASITFLISKKTLEIACRYDRSKYSKENIDLIDEQICLFTNVTTARPDLILSAIPLVTAADYQKIVYDWNATDKEYPRDKTIHELFEDQVLKGPDSTALVFEDHELTYSELNEKANQLARYIRKEYKARTKEELKADSLIALCLDRSLEMVIGILAVLKAGGAYVPIDPEYPKDRIGYILEDTGAELVLSQRHLGEGKEANLPEGKVLYIDLSEDIYKEEVTTNLVQHSRATDLAYVIYTSGTTGRPKGVMVEHGNVLSLTCNDYVKIGDKDVFAFLSSPVFDASTFELWTPLLKGGSLVIPKDLKGLISNIEEFERFLTFNKVSVLWLTKTLFENLYSFDKSVFKVLEYLIIGGEALDKETVSSLSAIDAKPKYFLNGYGPTESTTFTSTYNLYNEIKCTNVPIGMPIGNRKVYVLDSNLSPVPEGVRGELYIGGAGLSRGYLNNESLTSERFIDNPFASKEDKLKGYTRLYKTGDLVRYLPDGNLEYLGRNDDQVKIRGYRIELGEIEHVMSQVAGVKQSCVLAKERETVSGSIKYLVGYYVVDEDKRITESTILDELSEVLPEYMVPSSLVLLDSFPLTVNGKLDRRALPDPDFGSEEGYVAPVTETELTICKIWEEVLGVERVGVTDDFFKVGGDSILSIQVSSRIRKLGYDCQVKDIFTCKTVGKLSEHLDNAESDVVIQSEQGLLTGRLGLLPIQQWFISKVKRGLLGTPNHWNQSFLIRVPVLDEVRLSGIVEELVSYHDVLRIKYIKGDVWGQEYQQIIELPELKSLNVSDHSTSEIQQVLTDWQSGFDLEEGPLFQVGYLHGYADGSARIYFALHHIIVDGVSWRILAEDVKDLYSGNRLPNKGSSYRQWVESIKRYPLSHPEELSYWQEQLEGLPVYDISEGNQSVQLTCSLELSKKLTKSLLQEAPKAYHTEVNDLLLTALAYGLKEVNDGDSHGITLEGHGRENVDPSIDHSHTIGWYTSLFPVRLDLAGSIKGSIQSVKESLRSVPNKGVGFGAFATDVSTLYNMEDLPAISFNYLGQFGVNESDWDLVSEGSGISIHPSNGDDNLININGMVSAGKLRFGISTKLGEETTNRLRDSFKEHLTRVITHCTEKLADEGSSYTPSDFKTASLSQFLLDKIQSDALSVGTEVSHIYPANSLQQGFIYHALSQVDSAAYRVQVVYDYHEELDVDSYIKAWELCISQYPILRTAFNWEEELIQVIYSQGNLKYELHDLSDLLSQQERDARISFIQQEDRKESFDFTEPTQLRLHIIKQTSDYYTVIKTEHHIISDGWSWPVLFKSLHEYYYSFVSGKEVRVQEDTAYVAAQEYINSHKESISGYWGNVLGEVDGANDITGLLSNSIDLSDYKHVEEPVESTLIVSDERYAQLKLLSNREGITMNVIVQFLWHKLLQVYSSSSQSIVGTTISGRDLPIEGIEDSVGLYINTLPLVIDWDNDGTIMSQLHYIQDQISELNSHSFADLAGLQSEGERLFHSLLVFENYPVPISNNEAFEEKYRETLNVTIYNLTEELDYPLGIIASEGEGVLSIKLKYDGKYLTEEKAGDHMSSLELILDQVIANQDLPHREISLLEELDYQKIVYDWNATDKEYPRDKTIHELFEDQVLKGPDSTALVFEDHELTYSELNEKANQLARYIRKGYKARTKEELKADSLIALCLDRSLEMVIGILAVLKAGGAYVPIDPEYPKDRIGYILEDTGAELVLSQRHLGEDKEANLPEGKVLYIDLSEDLYKEEVTTNLVQHSRATDLAYVIYTSGTTGRPKGVMVEHHSLNNLIVDLIGKHNIESSERFLLFSNYVFDGSVSQMFLSLLSGSILFVIDNESILNGNSFVEYVVDRKITYLHATPTYLSAIEPAKLECVKRVVFGAEYVSRDLFAKYKKQIPKVINQYGPTEGTITSLLSINTHLLNKDEIRNIKVYVLDSNLSPVPEGVRGELYIGGAGLSRGYLNNESLTSERFIDNPFASKEDKLKGYTRLYKTGDLVRYLPDGNLEYLGRNDDQVKIRGYRIELGEIEHVMSQVSGVKQSCVLAKERETVSGSIKYLVGYYVADEGDKSVSESTILDELSEVLPEYMVPSSLVLLDSFPLTVNGKLDRRALPDPDFGSEEGYVAPVTETELTICKIWEEVLGVERVGVTDDFFKVGGDSILSIQVSSRIRKLGYDCQVKDIFTCKTVGKLSEHLDNAESDVVIQSEQGLLTGRLGLLPIQQWFISKVKRGLLGTPNHWNQSFLIRVPVLDEVRLSGIVEELVSYHDVLRIKYIKGDVWGQEYQQIIELPELKSLNVSDHSTSEIQQVLTDWQSGFDLEEGPLFQVGYLHGYADGSARIYFALHHIIVDGVSWRILAEDVKDLYSGNRLPNKGSSYRQWVESIKRYPLSHPEELSYWQEQLEGLPVYDISEGNQSVQLTCSLELSKKLTKSLLQEAPKAYHTEVNDLLLTALAYGLKEVNDGDSHGITLEGHGRENVDPSIDHSHTIGWYTSLFPVRLDLAGSIKGSIQSVKESLRSVPNKGVGFGAFATDVSTLYNMEDLPAISFNYLGQFGVNESDWDLVSEGSGISIHPSNGDDNLININGMVSAGKLRFGISTKLGEETTNRLRDSFKEHLTRVITHCTEKLADEGSSYTPSDFKTASLSQFLLDKIQSDALSVGTEVSHIYPANSLQQGFIYHALSQVDSAAYRVQVVYDYHEELDVDSYIKAWELCISQYPILRTAFNWEEELIQVIYSQGNLKYELHDLSDLLSQQERDARISFIQQEDRKESFDFTEPTQLRLHIIKQTSDYYTVIKTEHHIISDGWSGPVLFKSLHEYYYSFVSGKEVRVQEDTAYVAAQEYINSHKESISGYWGNVLGEVDGANDITGLLSNSIDLSDYKHVEEPVESTLIVSDERYAQLKLLSNREGITMNVIVQFLWHKLLQVYSSSSQSIVGATISGRDLPIEGIEDSVGLYINTLPLVIDWDNDGTIMSQLHYIQDQISELNSHSFADLAGLQSEGERLFHSLLVFENYPVPKVARGNGGRRSKISFRDYADGLDYPLGIQASEGEGVLSIKLKYDGKYLTEEKAGDHMSSLELILDQVIANQDLPHREISLLEELDYQKIVYDWNATDKEYPRDKTIHELFEDQVLKGPDSTALVFEDHELTYSELNEKANQLARYIRKGYKARTKEELKADSLIALCLDRSLEMVIGILAVLKAGGAYVPIDPEYPKDRIGYILEDTGAELVLSQRHLGEDKEANLPEGKVLYIDLSEDLYKEEVTTNLVQHSRATDLAYVIYTSGTTGRPKGVMVEHCNVMRLFTSSSDQFDFNTKDVWVLFHSYVFDFSVWELWGALIYGSRLIVITKEETRDLETFYKLCCKHKVSVLNQTPSTFYRFSDIAGYTSESATDLRYIIFGGEALNTNQLSSWWSYQTSSKLNTRLINMYGITETTVHVTYQELAKNDTVQFNIGRALGDLKVYVLDSNLSPVPVGVVGELYIGGAGLARGYLNNEELTQGRFIDNPFASKEDKLKGYTRLYKTGDLVRYLPDGNLEYLGRNDDQVKIRGYRIELAEIEHVMSQVSGVKQSCVLAKERETVSGSIKYLVGYYVLDSNHVSGKDDTVLDNWEDLYDSEYEKEIEEGELRSDFTGWNSYVTGEKIPLLEMELWRESILNVIRGLSPERVLEIGVGSGLLMYPLLEDVERYVGLDLSASVVNRHKSYFEGGAEKRVDVSFYHLKAHELDQLPEVEVYDTIVVNSVCQYFPGITYFNEMVESALDKLSSGGSIFLGDIRNYDLHKSLIRERSFYKEEEYTDHDIDRLALKENEFLISPGYFTALSKSNKGLEVSVLDRLGDSYSNELSKYRYDVVITKTDRDIDVSWPSLPNQYNLPYLNQLNKAEILDNLSSVLPEYMVPSSLVLLDSFPLTVNGKLDRRALPDPDFGSEEGYVAPVTETELTICKIWEEVLGVERIGVTDDFFKVGGNSILAIRVSHRMSEALKREVRVADVFKYNTVAALLSKSVGQSQIVIQATGSNESPLSFAQERLWFIEEYEGGTNAYHIPMLLELEPGTDKEGIKHALGKIVERHEVLRSTINGEADQAVQIVHDEPLLIEDISLTAEDDYEGIIKEDVNRPFDLSKDYPIRVRFYDIEDKGSDSKSGIRTVLLVNTHHIASDGWSTEVFQKELYGYYEAYVNKDEGFSFPALPIQYKDYALWQRSYLTGEVLEGQLSYWKDKLSGYETLALPTDYARPSAVDYSGAYHGFKVSEETSAKLRALAKTHGTTMQSVLLSATSVLFNKYTGQDDIVLGSPIANRQYSQTEGLIGFFVNTQVNRTHLNSGQSFASLIGQVHSDQVLSQQHQDLPFERLVDELGIERDLSRHPIFQVLFVVQSFGSQVETIEKQRSYFKPYQGQRGYDITKFDLEFFINDSQEELTCYISYATSLFNKETIRRLTGHYVHLLDQLVEFPDAPYSSHSLLTTADYQRIVYDWNATDKEYPRDKTIHELFEDQVLKGPDSTALVFEDHELTYSELNEKANQLARYIRKEYKARTKEELKADSLIALCLDRSLEMVIGILAVLKAGGAYVPIDPEYPKDRIGYILEDTGAELVLSQRHLEEGKEANLPEGKVLYIDLSEDIYKEEVTTNLAQHSRATDLAYVIYTSGTTGRPKGVMLEHYSLNNRISHIISYSGINPSDFHLFKTNYVFDASFFEVFTHLCIGARVQITKHLFELGELEHLLLSNEFTSLHLVPSQYELVSVIINTVKPSKIYFSGEALTSNILLDLDEEVKVYNYYGPTELGEITGAIPLAPLDAPVIGKIFPNCRYYVLDSNLSPVPVGVVGELYIGGAGLSRGYLNNESLTSERFIDNPFASKEDKLKGYTRLYKTGDLVRYLPDGNLEYLGRNDDQVKIRGYRIELGEIEHVMSQVAGVRQVCVLVKERVTGSGSIKYLVGYYVVDEDKRITESTILDELSEVLPEYMVPSSLVLLDSFPLTVNGKLDRRALPDPDFVDAEDYVAPVTETELTICKIWEEVLGVERIGVTDDFFKVGGNSILAIRVSHRMSEALKREVRVADVFKYNTVAALLSKSLGQSQIVIQATGSNESPLSFAQERLWFIEEYEGGTNAYHMPMLLELEPGTDKEGIKHALGKIVERHEVLRSTIDGESDQAVQIVHDEPLLIEDISLTAEDDYEGIIKEDVNRPFDLSKDYPIRVRFYDIEDKGSDSKSGIRTVLLVNTHHIASDGWSTEVFQKELYGYYEAYVNKDEGFSFPALPIQYKDYALWQRSYLTGEVLEGQLSYWKDKLSGYETLALPTDYARPSAVDYSGAYHGFKVSEETSAKLRALAKTHGTTMQSVLLSATSVLFNKYTGQDDIVLGSPIANRQYSQTEGLIGFFVNTQVNRTHLNSGQSFASLIGQVHSDQVLSQQHQDLPFERLVDELGIERDLSRHPIFQVLFVVQSFGSQVETIEKQRSYFKPYQGQRGYDITKFDLEFFINDSQEELTCYISYATSLFNKETIRRLTGHYVHLLDQLVEFPDAPYSSHSLLTTAYYQRIVYDWNATDKEYPRDKTIHELFEDQVLKGPDSTALVFEDHELTYSELNEKANQLARYIRKEYKARTKEELKADSLIALCLDRSLEMVIGILAVLKAGGAYVPIDPEYPKDRIGYILEDTGAELVLSQRHLEEGKEANLPEGKVLYIDLSEDIYKEEVTTNLVQHSRATDLAYVIYTSGTTGRPKGVMVEHGNVLSLTCNDYVKIGDKDVFAFLSSPVFDASTFELWTPLLKGGSLVIPKDLKGLISNIEEFERFLTFNKVSVLWLTKTLFENLYSFDKSVFKVLEYLIIGGEALDKETVSSLSAIDAKPKYFLNGYGPTESTTFTSTYNLYNEIKCTNVPIGMPIGNRKVYVLDSNLSPVPEGVRGELYIGGAGLSRGYLNNESLTSERFIDNPFASKEDKLKGYTRLYKTGDLVRYLPDGNLEYLGRNDDQVKIRGYRIELGEIEHVMSQVSGVKQSCVLAKERETVSGSIKYLVGYYVVDEDKRITESTILDELSEVLPEYMVPSSLVLLDSFPLTVNGKLDRRALPDPDFGSEEGYVAPVTETELTICKIWEDVLGVERIGVTDDFFKVGGNSILAIRVSHRMSEALKREVRVSDIFKYNTLKTILNNIEMLRVSKKNIRKIL